MNRGNLFFVLFAGVISFDTLVSGNNECLPIPEKDPSGNPTMFWNKNVKYTSSNCTSKVVYALIETCCPYCAKFVVDNICQSEGNVPPFTTGSVTCVHIEPIIYGNWVNGNCQHGTVECEMNKNFRCAVQMGTEKQMYSALCKHYQNIQNGDLSFQSHYEALEKYGGYNLTEIQDCINSGHDYMDMAAKQTIIANITGTPNFRVDNLSTRDDYLNAMITLNFTNYMCDVAKSPCCGYQCSTT